MGKRARSRTALTADLTVTVLGVVGFLGFLVAARMDDANSSPFDAMAYIWFFAFGGIKFCLPRFRSKREELGRAGRPLAPVNAVEAEPRWYRS
jgi:hypothetical protein